MSRKTNEHGARTDRIKEGSVVRGVQGGDPTEGGGRVRTMQVDAREGGRLSVHTVDDLEPQGKTDWFHVTDVTSIKKA